jgi:S1-C subfamily serine protease
LRRIFIFAAVLGLTALATAEPPKEVRDRAIAATVRVVNAADATAGSGAIIGRSGSDAYVLTAQHVVPKAETVEVTRPGGKPLRAVVLARSAIPDLAVLRLPAGELPTLPVAEIGAPAADPFSVGWEEGLSPTVRVEELRAKVQVRRPGESAAVGCWEAVRPPANGRSGGPLVDRRGRLIGLASGHDGKSGYYVHADEIHAFLKANALRWLVEDER